LNGQALFEEVVARRVDRTSQPTPRQQLAAYYWVVEGYDRATIGQAMGIGAGTVRNQLAAFRQRVAAAGYCPANLRLDLAADYWMSRARDGSVMHLDRQLSTHPTLAEAR
jgi:hypothetical protein